MYNTDVCIIGAGPAGTTASMFLSKHGVKHVLVERSQFPRDKVCGEFYDGRLRNVFNKLDATLLTRMQKEHIVQDIHRYYIFNAKLQEINFDSTANARVSTVRQYFDEFLLTEALKSSYVTYIDDTLVEDVAVNNNGVDVTSRNNTLQVQAQLAIVAAGSKSSIAKKVLPANQPGKHFLLAARGYYTGMPTTPGINCCRLLLLKTPVPCYVGTVDLPNGLFLIEVFVLKDVAAKHNINPKALLQYIIKEYEPLKKMFSSIKLHGYLRGASLPVTSGKKQISGNRILLAGDSGYNINPLTGLGVGRAVYSGMCAAEQCVKSLQDNNFSAEALAAYDKRVYKAFKADNRTGSLGDFILKHMNGVPQGLISVVSSSPYLRKKTATVLNKF